MGVVFCAHNRELSRLPEVTMAAVLMMARRFNNRSDIDFLVMFFNLPKKIRLSSAHKKCMVIEG